MATALTVSGPGGRTLEVEVAGPDAGETLIFHNGTPAAGTMFAPLVEIGAERGLRHVAYSRPGYGSSTRDPGRTVADCAQDVVAVADALGVERFYVAGLSGGGPHALACAALLPERVIAVATFGSVAPWDAEGLDFLEGMGEENHVEFGAAVAGKRELEEYLDAQVPILGAVTAQDVARAYGDLVGAADRDAITGGYAEYLAGATRRALETGIWGWFDDDLAFVAAWGFDLGAIERPVFVWQGGDDRFVPPAHAEWLAGHVAEARFEPRPEHGHLSLLVGAYGEALDQLIAAA
jgi:pimeloyl-ACP methyl ester carboxylesterase